MPSRLRSCTLLLVLVASAAAASVPDFQPELALGASRFRLRPSGGGSQDLDGLALSVRGILSPAWSLAAQLQGETGRELGGASLRRWGLLVGPRYTRHLGWRLDAFAQALAGASTLQATQGSQRERRASAAFAPGLGLELPLTEALALRVQAEATFTRFKGRSQTNPSLTVGAAWRPFAR